MMDSDQTNGTECLRRSVAVLVPCFNAGARILPVLRAACSQVDTVIVVDDGSTDGALDDLSGLPVVLHRFPQNQGKGFALLAGFREALRRPEIQSVATLDADGQHDPLELPGLYAALAAEHFDFVIGSRCFTGRDVPWRSRLGNRLTAWMFGLLLGRRLPDTQSGYRLHSRRFLEDVLETVPGGRYETEMEILVKAVRGPYRVGAAPIATIYETDNASSHFNRFRDSWRIYRRLYQALRRQR